MFGGEFPLTKSMEPLESFIVQTSLDFGTFATIFDSNTNEWGEESIIDSNQNIN